MHTLEHLTIPDPTSSARRRFPTPEAQLIDPANLSLASHKYIHIKESDIGYHRGRGVKVSVSEGKRETPSCTRLR